MHTQSYPRLTVMVLLAAAIAVSAVPALAQDSASVEQNWNDFIYYIRVARADVAKSYGQALIGEAVDANAIYRLSVSTGGTDKALAQAANNPELAKIVEALRAKIEAGYRLEARSPENIATSLKLLAGHARQMAIARQRLQESGEFAVPQMVRALGDPSSSVLLRDRIGDTLGLLGKDAVRPLCEALHNENPYVREAVCLALGRIGYAHAAPCLKAVLDSPDEIEAVKKAASMAMDQVTGGKGRNLSLADLYYILGKKYYDGEESVMPSRRFSVANVWRWEKDLGLTYTEVPSEIFLDVYAMRCARAALQADRGYTQAVTLWLQANLRKEADLPAGKTDPTRGANQLGADAYAAAAGAGYMQSVLESSLKLSETEVVKDAIRALAGTAGAFNLISSGTDSTPLVDALSYPDRRVRMMAADVLAQARPLQAFQGADLVVASLIEALRQSGQRTVLIIEPDFDTLNRYKDYARQAGYNVIDGDSMASGLTAVEQAGGADIVVLSMAVSGPDAEQSLGLMRQNPLAAVLPVVIVSDMPRMVAAKRMNRNDALTLIVEKESLDQAGLADAVSRANLMSLGDEPIEKAEAEMWMLTAAADIRLLGLSRCEQVFDLVRAEKALAAGLAHENDEIKVACANALAVVPSGTAQQAVVALAGTATSESVRVKAYLAGAESVRNFGRQLTDSQSQAVVDVVKSTQSVDIRNAASELLGALNLPSEQIKDLILGK